MDIKQLSKQIQQPLIQALKRLVAIESVQSEPLENAPFGIGPKQALDEALLIAQELGFETVNIDNKIGYALLKGASGSQDYFGIFGHVDVVPLGEGWNFPPLACQESNGKLYGRGVLDNKGPILSNLFALYALKEAGVTFKHDIRIVFGANEESGFGCVKHYLTKEKPPIFGWTPDCKWPTVYGERGRLKIRVYGKAADLYAFMNAYVFPDMTTGRLMGVNFKDDDFGEMMMRGYQMKKVDDNHAVEWALSYPASCTNTDIIERMTTCATPYRLTVEEIANINPVCYDKQSIYVQTLQKVYNDCTGLNATPVTTTGGTYAKVIPNIIAYGPSFPGQNNIAHLPDEWMDLNDLEKITEIYMGALYALKDMGVSLC